jgi:hypothetical protein
VTARSTVEVGHLIVHGKIPFDEQLVSDVYR